MAISKEPTPNKGAALKREVIALGGEWMNGDFIPAKRFPVKVKWHSTKTDEGSDVWSNLEIVCVGVNCFMSSTIDLPWWAVIDYKVNAQ